MTVVPSRNAMQPPAEEMGARSPIVLEPLSDQVHRVLLDRIISGRLAPGSRIDIPALTKEFGTSKTPIRQALVRLEYDRFVITKSRSGSYVRQPTIRDVDEICELRKAIEWLCTALATDILTDDQLHDLRQEIIDADDVAHREGDFRPFFRSDEHLHGSIVAATGNGRIIDVRRACEPYLEWIRVLGATGIHRIEASTQRHLDIVDAMIARDAARAQEVAARHVDEVRQFTNEDFSGKVVRFGDTHAHS